MDNHQILSEFFKTKDYKRISNSQDSHPLDAFIKFPRGYKGHKKQRTKSVKNPIKLKKRTYVKKQVGRSKQQRKKTKRKRHYRKKQKAPNCCPEVTHLQQLINNLDNFFL